MFDVIVIGAGQAGLASAHALQKAGLNFHVLEASDRAAGSWPRYYDSLKLFSPARHSSLPGLPFSGDPERYPLRDEVVQYLQDYARHFAFPITYHAWVSQIRREGDHFSVETADGKRWPTRTVISASGPYNQPNIPDFDGLTEFTGKILHSSNYRNLADVPGTRVAVVGSGNSAIQIAYELSQTHDVIVTAREEPRFIRQRTFGKDLHDWLTWSGLDTLPLGRWFGWSPTTPVLDTGIYRQAFAGGRLTYRPLFDRVTANGLSWGQREETFDALLMATGFVNQPAYLAGLDALDAASAARQKGGKSLKVPGLYFVGTAWQQSNASATLRGVGSDAHAVVRDISRQHNERASFMPLTKAVGHIKRTCCP